MISLRCFLIVTLNMLFFLSVFSGIFTYSLGVALVGSIIISLHLIEIVRIVKILIKRS